MVKIEAGSVGSNTLVYVIKGASSMGFTSDNGAKIRFVI
jgi:hypothetical protein